MKTYQTDEGRLFQVALKNPDGTERTVNFTRNYSFGSERILSAHPITLSDTEWKMFVDRGHGLYATSMITRVIGTLGQYIAQVEREYGIYPTKDPVTGNYFLSEAAQAALKARDPNAWAKYNTIQNAQDQLRSLYALEREIDPNHPELQRDFKHDVRKILDDLRGALYQQKQWTIDRMDVSSDHIVAAAHEQIIKFEWPNNAEGRRFAITAADQLLVTPGARITYDPSKEPSSAAGGSVFSTTSGFGEAGRDNFAHCITLTDGFDSKQRSAFMSEVRKLKPSEGLRLEATSQKDRAKEMESKRIALAVLSKPDTLAASFKELTDVYNTPEGGKICEEKFGCDFEALKANVLFQMMVHAQGDVKQFTTERTDTSASGKTHDLFYAENSAYNEAIVAEKKKAKPDKEKIASLETARDRLVELHGKAFEKREARQKTLAIITTELKRKEITLPSHALSSRELFKIHAQKISEYCLSGLPDYEDQPSDNPKEAFEKFRKAINSILEKYPFDFCNEVLGASRSELQEAVLRHALFELTHPVFEEAKINALKSGQFLDLFREVETERTRESASEESVDQSAVASLAADRVIPTKPDPLLDAKAKEIADSAAAAENPIAFIQSQAAKRAPDQEKRLVSLALYRYALECSDAKYAEIKGQLATLLSPYHDIAALTETRALIKAAEEAKKDFEVTYQQKYKEKLGEQLALVTDAFTIEKAIETAKKATLEDPAVKAKEAAVKAAVEKIYPPQLKTDHEMGDTFLRMGVAGFTYKLVDPIFGVLEKMGLHDPIRGSIALGVIALTASYVAIAHGATVAAAGAKSKFMHLLSQTYLIPEVYKNVVILTPQASGLKTALAALADGVTLGKAVYLLSSTADMAVTGRATGFTGHMIAGIMNNPIETSILLGVMALMGHGMVIGLHEQADMGAGGWQIMGGLFEALKAADVGYHAVLEIQKIVAYDAIRSPEGLRNPEGVKALFANMLAEKIFSGLTAEQQSTFSLPSLKEKFTRAFENIDISDPSAMNNVTEKFLASFTATEKAVIQLLVTKPQESTTQNALIEKIKGKFGISEERQLDALSEADRIRYGLCVQQALQLKAAKPELSDDLIAAQVMMMVPEMKAIRHDFKILEALYTEMRDKSGISDLVSSFVNITSTAFLEKLYPEKAAQFSAGFSSEEQKSAVHQKHKHDFLAGFFIQEILTEKSKNSPLWQKILAEPKFQTEVESIAGIPFAALRDQEVPAYRTTAEKMADVAKAAAIALTPTQNLEGAGKIANLPGRLAANATGAIGTAAIRGVTFFTPTDQILRGEAYFNRAGQEAARGFSRTTGKYTVIRPDDVSSWRRSFSEPVLVTETKASSITSDRVTPANFYDTVISASASGSRDIMDGFFKRLFDGAVHARTDERMVERHYIGEASGKYHLARPEELAGKEKTTAWPPEEGKVCVLRQYDQKHVISSDINAQALHLLKSLFTIETRRLEEQLHQKQIVDPAKRDEYLLASLQKLCRDEMLMCDKKERDALAKNPVLVEMLTGEKIDFKTMKDDKVTAMSERIAEETRKVRDNVFYFATAVKHENEDKKGVAAASYRFDKTKSVSATFEAVKMQALITETESSQAASIDVLKQVCTNYQKDKTLASIRNDSYLITRLKEALETVSGKALNSDKQLALHVLSHLFPTEKKQLDTLMMQQRPILTADQRNEKMLVALQQIFGTELSAAAEKSKNAYTAFKGVMQSDTDLCKLLTGSDRFPEATQRMSVTSVVAQGRAQEADDIQHTLQRPLL